MRFLHYYVMPVGRSGVSLYSPYTFHSLHTNKYAGAMACILCIKQSGVDHPSSNVLLTVQIEAIDALVMTE